MGRLLLVLLVLTASGAGVPAQAPDATDGPAVRQLKRWVEAFNAADPAAWERFLADAWPSRPAGSIGPWLAFKAQTGGFELVRVESADATRAVAIVRERDAESIGARLTIEIGASEPHHVVNLLLEPGVRLPSTTPRLTEQALAAALPAEIERRAAAGRFSGAVLVAKGEREIYAGAAGLADREEQRPNTVDTRLRNGSMNKMFTAVATLALVQDGTLTLDAPIVRYLPDYPNQALASTVTIHHLLTHTGGTGEVFGPEFFARRLELRTHADYLRQFGGREALFASGSRWMYSNYGYILLGAIIERVSGQSYYDYVRERVYARAGMSATGSEPEDVDVPGRAAGYTKAPGASTWEVNTPTLPYRGTAAGGGYTTVRDLHRFATALTADRLLDPRHTALLTTGKAKAPYGRYAYGFIERQTDGGRSIGHGGNAPGMDGDLTIFPETGYVVAVLANMDTPAAQRVSEFIVNRLPR